MLPEKLIEFVNIPELKPFWAHDIRLWQTGLTEFFDEDVEEFITGPSYTISFSADLLRVLRISLSGFSFYVMNLLTIQKSLGCRTGELENAERSGFSTISCMCHAVSLLAAKYSGLAMDQISCSVMPKDGSPWNMGEKETFYYSVRAKKYIKSTPPPQKIVDYYDMGKMVTRPVIDWCEITPFIGYDEISQKGLGFTFSSDRYEEIYLASHCFTKLDGMRKAIKECKGLLLPSLSAGLLPSNNFGPLVLIADPSLVLSSLKPYYSGRGQLPVHVYPTDTWTITTSSLFGESGAQALKEWTGNDYDNLVNDFELLLSWTGSRPEPPLRQTKQLRSRLTRLRKIYNDPDLDINSISYTNDNYYPYIEAKINGIMPLSCFTMAFCPVGVAKPLRAVLRRGGFAGSVLSVKGWNWEDVVSESGESRMNNQEMWDYGWDIRNMLLKYLNTNPNRLLVVD